VPPAPSRHFEDRARFVPPEAAARLDGVLRDFESRTRTQIVVVIFPELPSPSLEDFTVRAAQAWRVGRKGLDDGVVLFVFVKERRLRLEVGYGLEARIPDATANRILDGVVAPEMKAGRPAAAFEAGLRALMAAIEGQSPTEPGALGDDVPMPPSEPLADRADLIPAEREPSLLEAVETFRSESACRLSIVILPGGPDRYTTGYLDPQLFAVRSFLRSRPRPGGAEDAEYFQELETDPSGLLFAFTGDEPGQAAFGFFGSGSCPAEATARAILDHELAPRFAADPAAALKTALDLFGRARRGEYTPPTPAPPPASPPPTASDSVIAAIAAIGSFRLLGLPVGSLGLLAVFVTVVTLPTRGLAIRRRMKQGQGFGYAFLREAAVVATFLFTSSGRSYSSGGSSRGGSSGGFSGGGGRFGGGGASGSW
jgi:uncharacterized membrane protein YgcG